MEALLLILNSGVIAVAVVMSLLDERRNSGKSRVSIFRYAESAVDTGAADKKSKQARLDKSVI